MAPLRGPLSAKYQANGLTWQEVSKNNLDTITAVIEDFTLLEPENGEDKLPNQLLEVGNNILYISRFMTSVRSHKEDFERLSSDASSLILVFWQLYNTLGIHGVMWPPPNLTDTIDKLVDTVYFIYKLMKRKSQKNIARRILEGYFGLRDLGKFKKYQRKLDDVASRFESGENKVKIIEVLLEIIENKTQDRNEDEDSERDSSSVEVVQAPARKTKRAATQEASAERPSPRLRKAKAKSEAEESSADERVGVEGSKAAKRKTARRQSEARPEPQGTKSTTKARRPNFDEEAQESEDKGKRSRFQESEDVEEGTPRRGSRTTNTAQSKTKKRVDPVDDGEEYTTADVPSNDPVAPKRKPKQKTKPLSTPERAQSAPSVPQYSISGFSFNNESGNIANLNVGNIYNSSISDANNDNSVNTFHGRRKPA